MGRTKKITKKIWKNNELEINSNGSVKTGKTRDRKETGRERHIRGRNLSVKNMKPEIPGEVSVVPSI